jgi:hypothetical protein
MRILARIVSYLFHPLLFPFYGTLLIIAANPSLYGPFGERLHGAWLIIILALTFVFPLVWLGMMKRLDMIESFDFATPKDRIIPFIAIATFYLWTAWMFKPNTNMKIPANQLVFFMMLGSCLSIFLAFFVNIFSKISLHTVAAGSFLGLLLTLIRISTYDLRIVLIGAILLAGAVGTARLILKGHSPREIFTGYAGGFIGQFIAFTILPKFL